MTSQLLERKEVRLLFSSHFQSTLKRYRKLCFGILVRLCIKGEGYQHWNEIYYPDYSELINHGNISTKREEIKSFNSELKKYYYSNNKSNQINKLEIQELFTKHSFGDSSYLYIDDLYIDNSLLGYYWYKSENAYINHEINIDISSKIEQFLIKLENLDNSITLSGLKKINQYTKKRKKENLNTKELADIVNNYFCAKDCFIWRISPNKRFFKLHCSTMEKNNIDLLVEDLEKNNNHKKSIITLDSLEYKKVSNNYFLPNNLIKNALSYQWKSSLIINLKYDEEIYGVVFLAYSDEINWFRQIKEKYEIARDALRKCLIEDKSYRNEAAEYIENLHNIAPLIYSGMMAASHVHDAKNYLDTLPLTLSRLINNQLDIELSKKLKIVTDRVKVAITMCENVLNLSSPNKFQKRKILLKHIMEDLKKKFNPEADNDNIRFTFHTEKSLIYNDLRVYADKNALFHALYNLLKNSKESLEQTSNKEKFIKIHISNDRNFVYINFIDNGIGIESKDVSNVFRFLFTTKGYLGTGIGLGMTKLIVENHQGKIDCQSVIGNGASFKIILPLA